MYNTLFFALTPSVFHGGVNASCLGYIVVDGVETQRGYFPTNDAQTHPLRSGHLDIRDAECAKKMMGAKLKKKLGAAGLQKVRFGHSKM